MMVYSMHPKRSASPQQAWRAWTQWVCGLTLALVCLSQDLSAQVQTQFQRTFPMGDLARTYGFTRMGLESGLSHTRIYALLQDRTGYIWVGTSNGLNRHDGTTMATYPSPGDDGPRGPRHNYITSLAQGLDGDIWIGTNGGGVSRYHANNRTFSHYFKDSPDPRRRISDDTVWGLLVAKDGSIWVASTYGGLSRIVPDESKVEIFRGTGAEGQLSYSNTWPLAEDTNGDIWIGTDGGGLNRYVQSSGTFITYKNDPNNPKSLSNDYIFSLHIDLTGRLWVGTAGGGLNGFNRMDSSFTRYARPNNAPVDAPGFLSNNSVRGVLQDRSGRFWVGTTEGLNLFDPTTGLFLNYFHEYNNPRSLSNSRIHTLMEDSLGRVWMGTRDGISIFVPPRAYPLLLDSTSSHRTAANDIRSLLSLEPGKLLVGTAHGLYQISNMPRVDLATTPDGTQVSQSTKNREDTIKTQILWEGGIVYALARVDDAIFLGTSLGLYTLDLASMEPRLILDKHRILTMEVDKNKVLWLGTEDRGVVAVDSRGRVIWRMDSQSPTEPRLATQGIMDMRLVNSDSLVIIDQTGSLGLMDINTGLMVKDDLFKNPDSQWQAPRFRLILGVQASKLILGLDHGGIGRLDLTTGEFTVDPTLPLNGPLIQSMISTRGGQEVLGSLNGVLIQQPNGHLELIGTAHGLPGIATSPKSVVMDSQGSVYLGTSAGLALLPQETMEDVQDGPPLAGVVETDNDLITISPSEPPRTITLGSTITRIRIHSLDFINNGSTQYAYRLHGKDTLYPVDPPGTFILSGLGFGTHKIELLAGTFPGQWYQDTMVFYGRVIPPWWLRWFMIPLYGGLFVLALVGFSRYRNRSQAKRIEEQSLVVQEKTAQLDRTTKALEKALEEKSNFFVNIAHETLGPLTLVQNYLARVTKDQGKNTDIEIIHDNLAKLVRDVKNYLAMESMHHGQLGSNTEAVIDLGAIITHNQNQLASMATLRDQTLVVASPDNLVVRGNLEACALIVSNLVDNATKYCPQGGTIHVELTRQGSFARLSISDNGPGLQDLDQLGIHDPLRQLSQPKDYTQGLGLGLYLARQLALRMGSDLSIQSSPSIGTRISLDLPLVDTPLATMMTQEIPTIATHRLPPRTRPTELPQLEHQKTLLLLDSDTDFLNLLAEELGRDYNLLYAETAEEVLSRLPTIARAPDLIIAELALKGMDGHIFMEALGDGPWKAIPLIFVTVRDSQTERLRSIRQGAVDFIGKPLVVEELHRLVEARLQGQERRRTMLMSSVKERIKESLVPLHQLPGAEPGQNPLGQQTKTSLLLSPREDEILQNLLLGRQSKEIAGDLGISVRTVERHIYNLYRKAGVQNRMELLAYLRKTT